MEREVSWVARRDELVAKLVQRAVRCPGLYPFREAADFLRVAQDQAGTEVEAVCRALEMMWNKPEATIQLNAQSLIRQGQGWERLEAQSARKAKNGTQGSTAR